MISILNNPDFDSQYKLEKAKEAQEDERCYTTKKDAR